MDAEKWKSKYGYELSTYSWPPPDGEVTFIVYLIHGYAEYVGHKYYQPLVKHFNSLGAAVYGNDHFGHGESGPYAKEDRNRCQIKNFDESTDDVIERINLAKEKHPSCPVILCGHSMGGLISLMVGDKFKVDGMILIAPALKVHPNVGPPWLVAIGKFLGFVLPWLKVSKVDPNTISRDPEVVEFYKTVITRKFGDNGGATAGFGRRLLMAQEEMMNSKLHTIECPILMTQGTDDFLCDKSGSDAAVEKMKNVTYNVYPDAYHQLHAELQNVVDALFRDISFWLTSQNFTK